MAPVISQMGLYKNEYHVGADISGPTTAIGTTTIKIQNTLFGSESIVSLTCKDSIYCESKGCIAAPIVHMFAVNEIRFGAIAEKHSPARLFAVDAFTLTTKHLTVGDFKIVDEPNHGLLQFEKLTLIRTKGEDAPDSHELVRSWGVNEYPTIETIWRD